MAPSNSSFESRGGLGRDGGIELAGLAGGGQPFADHRHQGVVFAAEEGIGAGGIHEQALDLEAELGVVAAGACEIGVALVFRNYFFHHHINHGTGCKGKGIGQ